MTDTCPKCMRPRWPAGALSAPHMVHCWQEGGRECDGYAAGYQRGLRDAAARMVEIAPEDLVKVRFDTWAPNGEPHECDAAERIETALRAHAAKAEAPKAHAGRAFLDAVERLSPESRERLTDLSREMFEDMEAERAAKAEVKR